MSEVEAKPLFDQITIDQMRANEAMTKVVLSVVRDACRHSKGRYTVESVADGLNRPTAVVGRDRDDGVGWHRHNAHIPKT